MGTQTCFSIYRKDTVTWQKWSINKERNSENVITRHMENNFQASPFKIKKF